MAIEFSWVFWLKIVIFQSYELWLFPIYGKKTKNVPNHQPEYVLATQNSPRHNQTMIGHYGME